MTKRDIIISYALAIIWAMTWVGLVYITVVPGAATAASASVPSVPGSTRVVVSVGPAPTVIVPALPVSRTYPTIHMGKWSSLYAYSGDTLGNVSAFSVGVNVSRSDYPTLSNYRSTGAATNFYMQTTDSGAPNVSLRVHPSGISGAGLSASTASLEMTTTSLVTNANNTTISAVNMTLGGTVNFTGSVTSSRACDAGYTRRAPNYCARTTPGTINLDINTCTTITAPTGANAMDLQLRAVARANLAISIRSSAVNIYANNSCITAVSGLRAGASAYEHVAVAATTELSSDHNQVTAPVVGSVVYLRSDSASFNEGFGSYTIMGYFD